MEKLINGIGKAVKVVGMLGVMFALALSMIGASSASADDGNIPQGKLSVYAVNAKSGNPVGGAYVVVINGAGQSVAKGYASTTGEFSAQLPIGSYKVNVSASGFVQNAISVQIFESQLTAEKIALTPAPVHSTAR